MWNQKDPAVLIELDAPIDDPEQPAVESALPFDGRSCSYSHLMPGESLEVGQLHQGSFEPRGAHLEAVTPWGEEVVVDVERGRYVAANRRTILQRNPAADLWPGEGPVDDYPNHRTTRLAQIAHVDQIHAVSAANWGNELLEGVEELFGRSGQGLLGPLNEKGRTVAAHPEKANQNFRSFPYHGARPLASKPPVSSFASLTA